MNPLLQQAIGSVLRCLLAIGAGWLVKHGVWESTDAKHYVGAASMALLAIGWSLWQKYHSRVKVLTALAMPQGSTENELNTQIITKETPPISTPVNTPPEIPLAKP
jgi:hypothetical protein